jgi:urease accessory protein
MDVPLTAAPALSATLQPRARGEARLAVRALGGRTALADLRQAGSLKLVFPQGAGMTAMVVNTAGGVTGGDRFSLAAEARDRSRLTLTTQAAERLYAALPGEAGRISNRLQVGAGARLDWLPQETILYDRARIDRALNVDMAPDATLLAVEPLVFGRKAMGEHVRQAALTDRIRLIRSGDLLLADTLRLHGDAEAILARTAASAGAAATLLYAAPDAEARLAPLRDRLPDRAGASLARPGLIVARFLADDGYALRAGLIPALTLLHGSDLPRSWML